MILVTGGAGFIGSHTVRALTEAGQECVLLQRRTPQIPAHLADLPIHVVQADVADLDALLAVGRQYPITGIVHLAVAVPWSVSDTGPIEATGAALEAFLNIIRAARAWSVRRVVTASTIGVYGFASEGALTEDMPIPFGHFHAIPTFKKITELLAGHLAEVTDVGIVNARISGTWGPGGHLPDPFFAAPSLAHAAAQRSEPDLSGLITPPHAEDALDLLYVKDTGRALALLQLAEKLHHSTYNVASGRATSNADVATAITSIEPDFHLDIPSGGDHPVSWLDITRLREDTGFHPRYDTAAAAADYITWLRAGNQR
ncbi:NAD-dependent epimerase/dehydratase family protein [Kineococcus radiotolerans]|uniref:NAD-dependent epimerase/dehydratase n=1 Tax=Kineococcus radiotolerans (strain ATCC BAA-149 / DSM 14245 / SRS30216) TaxID=266940 RepID=A6WB79_KINRD|nr:NAD(P)-dependent oxidoreductase [Kineococcus radiotolerans]ABS04068.1 NAD-dependent epimerase/dehydratase [Kineococcus radiotolerans SRS30216 = ATCC BAA-149]